MPNTLIKIRWNDSLGTDSVSLGSLAPEWNYADQTYDFSNVQADEITCKVQLPHTMVEGGSPGFARIRGHIHYIQQSADAIGWKMDWKVYGLGALVTLGASGWTEIASYTNNFTYTSGDLHQLGLFGEFATDTVGISDFVLIRIRRPVGDAYSGLGKLLGVDLHVLVDDIGSESEGKKHAA